MPPLGYDAQDHKLVVIDSEAELVRFIFRRYAELGSVRLLKEELDACGIRSKSRTSASGRTLGGKPFSRGALYLILKNRTYLGEIIHRGNPVPANTRRFSIKRSGEAVQAQLAENAAARNSSPPSRQPSPLAGILFDRDGNRMTTSHAVKRGTRYRYYVSRPLITGERTEIFVGLRIPAGEIEQLVTSRMRQWLLNRGSI